MKYTFIFCLLLLFSTYGWAKNTVTSVENTVTQMAADEQTQQLSSYVRSLLQNYYNRQDFNDPGRKTGWYRVDEFIKWVRQHEAQLSQSHFRFSYIPDTFIPQNYDFTVSDFITQQPDTISPHLQRAFWVYLGIRYLAHIYGEHIDFSPVTLIGTAYPSVNTGVQFGGIVLNTHETESLPSSINLGIHEGTHYIPLLMGPKQTPFNETAAFYSQYNYGLPVKATDIKDMAEGTRDVRRLHAAHPELPIYQEYNAFIAGLLLQDKLTASDTWVLQDKDWNSSLSLWEMLLTLRAAKRNQFLINRTVPGQTDHVLFVSAEELLQAARQFGFTQQQLQQALDSPASIVDLGDTVWPNTAGEPEPVVLQKTRQHFILAGNFKRINRAELMRLAFGDFADTPALNVFYDTLQASLPPQVLQLADQLWPVVIEEHYTAAMAQKLIIPYETQWNEAIIHALNTVAPPVLPMPAGYL